MTRPSLVRIGNRMARGAVAGTAATLPMSLLMLGAQKLGWMGKQPPEKITEAALDEAVDEPVAEPVEDALSTVNHFLFGAVAGAAFGAVRLRDRSAVPQGVVFGMIVWSVSYMGWVPALDILPPATRDREGRPASMIAAHVVFGSVLGALVQRLDPD